MKVTFILTFFWPNLHSHTHFIVSGRFDNPMFMRGPYCEEQELPYDFQRHFAEMQLTENSVPNPFNHGFSMDELKAPIGV